MFHIYPKVLSSVKKCGTVLAPVSARSFREEMSQPWGETVRNECSDIMWSLPLRYSGLSVRRRLIRMMLTLQKCGAARGDPNFRRGISMPAADYARAVIDKAMLCGELRCRPSGEMALYYLSQTDELLILMAGVRQSKALLRKEVRCRTSDFLNRYMAGTAS